MLWPKIIAMVMTTIVSHWSTMIWASTNIPTDTKKMAPKRSFTGATTFSIFFASTVSASMLPITNAPKAELKPALVESTAIKQHIPRATISSTSSFIRGLTRRRKVGIRNSPTTNHIMMTKPM